MGSEMCIRDRLKLKHIKGLRNYCCGNLKKSFIVFCLEICCLGCHFLCLYSSTTVASCQKLEMRFEALKVTKGIQPPKMFAVCCHREIILNAFYFLTDSIEEIVISYYMRRF